MALLESPTSSRISFAPSQFDAKFLEIVRNYQQAEREQWIKAWLSANLGRMVVGYKLQPTELELTRGDGQGCDYVNALTVMITTSRQAEVGPFNDRLEEVCTSEILDIDGQHRYGLDEDLITLIGEDAIGMARRLEPRNSEIVIG